MKLNINKACDLKSISVFPPNLRRRSSVEPQSSQQQQLRYSQHSQQSFSQVPSPQRGCFSQMTQSSGEELILNDQRFGSQDRDIPLKKNSFLPPINHNKRDDTQMVASRSSSGLTSRWSSASLGDSKSQISEEFEQRFGMMETSLSKFGMMLDSIQTGIMQTNRGTNEVFLEIERIHQKLILQDTSLHQLIKEQADVKANLDGAVKSILEELSKDLNQEKLQNIVLMLTAIPKKVETSLEKIQREICSTFTIEKSVLASLKMPEPIAHVPTALQVKAKENLPEQHGPAAKVKRNASRSTTPKTKQQPQLIRNPDKASGRSVKACVYPKTQVVCWKTVKPDKSTANVARKKVKPRTQIEQGSIVIESDEDIDGGFSCLLNGNTKGANIEWDAEKETDRLMKTARRKKRKFGNPIIITD